jgi:microcystin-dependent protein
MPRNGSGTASIVNTFTPLTTADANDVNENFTDIATMITDSLPRDGQAGMSGQFLAISGTVDAPGMAFNADTNTGIRRPAGDQMALVCGGADVATVDSTGVSVSTAPTAGGNLANKTYVDSKAATEAAAVVTLAAPPGAVSMFAANAAPSGWLECDGAAVSRTTYAALFAVVGTTWGAGDGSTTFNLPDLRGEFVRGWDHGKGTDSGRAFASSQTDALQNITGSFEVIRSAIANANGPFTSTTIPGAAAGGGTIDGGRVTFNASLAARTATETRPRNIALMYIIKT